MDSTFEQLSAIVIRIYKLPAERLALDTPLESLGVDSLGVVELLWTVEESFAIRLPPESPTLRTLGDVVRHIDDLVARQAVARGRRPGDAVLQPR